MKKIKFIIPLLCISSLVLLSASKPDRITNMHYKKGLSDSTASFNRGKAVYKAYCLSCHQFDAGGVENLNPPLIKTAYVLGNKARIINIVLKGFSKRVDIQGDSYANNMPPLNYLTNQQIADVLTYVRNDFGNKASSVKVAEVKAQRAIK